jgi:very-short-patch-repair endonuclease
MNIASPPLGDTGEKKVTQRDKVLNAMGLRVFRFKNEEIVGIFGEF